MANTTIVTSSCVALELPMIAELSQRRVFRVVSGYSVVCFIILQIADVAFESLGIGNNILRVIIAVMLLALPLVAYLAWVFDVAPDSKIQRASCGRPWLEALVAGTALVLLAIRAWFIVQEPVSTTNQDGLPAVVTDSLATKSSTGVIGQPEMKSIAVLALDNLSPDPNNAYFASGVHEEILNQLVKISDIQVTSRTTALRYENSELSVGDIARELNVSTVLEGSVRFAGNKVRITTQLIRATDDVHLWSETYEFELEDIFAIQSAVAIEIANALQATLSPEEIASIESPATENIEAYTLYLQHRHQLERERARLTADEDGWIKSGLRKMERAVDLAPSFALGLAELAFLNFYKGSVDPANAVELRDEAVLLAKKAIAIDPTLALAYLVLQRVAFQRRQWTEWENNVRKSLELVDLNGGTAATFAIVLFNIGRVQESYHWLEVAISKDPQSPILRELAVAARFFGQYYEHAIKLSGQSRAVGGDENVYHAYRAYAFHRLGMQIESLNELNKITTEQMNVPVSN